MIDLYSWGMLMGKNVGKLFLYCFLLSLAVSYIPNIFGNNDPMVNMCANIIAILLLLLFLGNSLVRSGCFDRGAQVPNWKDLLILSPVAILLVGFFVANLTSGYEILAYNISSNNEVSWLFLLYVILHTIYDELLFRIVLQYEWAHNYSRIKRILYPALAYAAFFGLFGSNFSISSNPLINALSTFGGGFLVGCILGFLMEYTHSIYVCLVYSLIHTLLIGYGAPSILLTYLFECASFGRFFFDSYYLITILAEVISALYLVLIYNFYFKKKEY